MKGEIKRWWDRLTRRGVGARVDLPNVDAITLGTEYGGHAICPTHITPDSVVYSFGVGEDISFDLALIERFGVTVHAFDPTPRSVAWIQSQTLDPRFVMRPVGIAATDGTANFAPPEDPSHVSHTLLDRPATDNAAFEVPVKRLQTLMAERGHSHLDILKMDVEGVEYEVLDQVLAAQLPVAQILVEFHHQFPAIGPAKTRDMIDRLRRSGYRIFSISDGGHEFSFLKT